jgi:hypothetical protein
MIGPIERRLRILEYRLRQTDYLFRDVERRTNWFEERFRELNQPVKEGPGSPPCPGLACVRVQAQCAGWLEGIAISVTVGATEIASGVTDANGEFCFDPSGYIGDLAVITASGYAPSSSCTCWAIAPADLTRTVRLACNTHYGTMWWIGQCSPHLCCSACYVPIPLSREYEVTNWDYGRVVGPYGCTRAWQDASGVIPATPERVRMLCSGGSIYASRTFYPFLACGPPGPSYSGCFLSVPLHWVPDHFTINGVDYPAPGFYLPTEVAANIYAEADSFTCCPFSAVFTFTWSCTWLNTSTLATETCGPISSTVTLNEP